MNDRTRSPRFGAVAVAAAIVLGLLAVAAVFAPWLAPYDPVAQLDLAGLQNSPPSWRHPLGTDAYSRDLLSRALFGARASLTVATVATGVAIAIGTLWGGIAAIVGARAGGALMNAADVMRSVPRVLVLLAVAVLAGDLTPVPLGLVIGLSVWPVTSRLVYALVRAISSRPFIEASVALGAAPARTLATHILPQLAGPLAASGALLLADTMTLEAGLSFIGLGVKPPNASWGSMVQDALPYLSSAWWVAAVPCALVVTAVLCAAHLVDAATAKV